MTLDRLGLFKVNLVDGSGDTKCDNFVLLMEDPKTHQRDLYLSNEKGEMVGAAPINGSGKIKGVTVVDGNVKKDADGEIIPDNVNLQKSSRDYLYVYYSEYEPRRLIIMRNGLDCNGYGEEDSKKVDHKACGQQITYFYGPDKAEHYKIDNDISKNKIKSFLKNEGFDSLQYDKHVDSNCEWVYSAQNGEINYTKNNKYDYNKDGTMDNLRHEALLVCNSTLTERSAEHFKAILLKPVNLRKNEDRKKDSEFFNRITKFGKDRA